MKRFFLILFFFAAVSFAQEITIPTFTFPDSTYRVSEIVVVGNEQTKSYVITQEMSLKKDSLITREAAQFDIDRIYSLRLFTKVDIHVNPDSGNYATLQVMVNERWYFYPFPIVGIKDRDFAKLFFGLGLIHNNVSGSNVRIYGAFALGYDPFVSLNYINPQIDIENDIFFSARSYYSEQKNRSLDSLKTNVPEYYERRYGTELTLGKRFSLFSLFTLKGEYLNISVTNIFEGRTLSPNGKDEFFSLHAAYFYDTRDLKEYPDDGTYFSVGVSKFGLGEEEVNYQRFGFDFRRYIPTWSNVTLSGRIFSSIATGGRIPNYGHTFFGYGDRIRGYFNKIVEGEQITGSTVEVHVPIVSPRYIHFGFIPIEQFQDVRYALNVAFFADAGNTWYRKEPFTLNKFYSGYGFGLHFLLAYSAVVRLEFGIPYQGEPGKIGEVILDIGAAL